LWKEDLRVVSGYSKANNNPELLSDLSESSELPRGQVVIAHTPPEVETPAGLTVFEDFSPPNVQKWWKTESEESDRVAWLSLLFSMRISAIARVRSRNWMVNSSGREPP